MLLLRSLLASSSLARPSRFRLEMPRAKRTNPHGAMPPAEAAAAAAAAASQGPSGPVSLNADGSVSIRVHAKPGAKQSVVTAVEDEPGGSVSVSVSAAPMDGAANSELLRFLAAALGVRRGDLALDKGARSRQKVVRLAAGRLAPDAVHQRLQSALGNT
uniref:UPF0235 protein C15orf40 homolog n=1 Tax=Petromyzon marinus TaxID=7757 RepID=A0AAJ7XJX5_PETMA|nr:UPF0235 protein C15orf40 homolog [Petromyzon marinus]